MSNIIERAKGMWNRATQSDADFQKDLANSQGPFIGFVSDEQLREIKAGLPEGSTSVEGIITQDDTGNLVARIPTGDNR